MKYTDSNIWVMIINTASTYVNLYSIAIYHISYWGKIFMQHKIIDDDMFFYYSFIHPVHKKMGKKHRNGGLNEEKIEIKVKKTNIPRHTYLCKSYWIILFNIIRKKRCWTSNDYK